MKKFIRIFVFLATIANLFVITYLLLQTPVEAATSSQPAAKLTINSAVNLEYLNLTDQQKKGRMFMVSISGTTLSDADAKFLKENKISGVILMPGNIKNELQVKQLTTDLKNKVDKRLIIAIDQEGGTVVRIPWDKYAQYSPKDVTAGKSPNFEEMHEYRAKLLKDLGINMILGPVADLAGPDSFMYQRSYGTNAKNTADFVETEIRIYAKQGILTSPKHFPGHGSTNTDSHSEFPQISKSQEELKNYEFVPFQTAVDSGVPFIMIGHIVNPQISSKPTSISPEYKEILEDEMGFEGLIITDDLKMTGKINGGINWGINLTIEDRNATLIRLSSISPEEKYVKKVLELRYEKL